MRKEALDTLQEADYAGRKTTAQTERLRRDVAALSAPIQPMWEATQAQAAYRDFKRKCPNIQIDEFHESVSTFLTAGTLMPSPSDFDIPRLDVP